MSAVIECAHGDPDPSLCPPCQGTPPPAPAVTWTRFSFTASWGGHCDGCGFEIRVGEQVRRGDHPGGRVEYRHAACTEVAA